MSCGSADGRVILGGMDLGRERARKRNAGLARVLDHFFHRLAQLLQDRIAVAAMHASPEQFRTATDPDLIFLALLHVQRVFRDVDIVVHDFSSLDCASEMQWARVID